MLRLHDTAEGRVVDVVPRQPGKFSMYVCGPTVYDAPHIGHGRFALVFDVLRRYLEWSGLDVTYISNITDIEDKIIDRAAEQLRPVLATHAPAFIYLPHPEESHPDHAVALPIVRAAVAGLTVPGRPPELRG